MRRFLPGATSFKSSSSVRLENILLALSTTSRQELIATCTDNLWDVIVISLFFDPCPSFVQPRPELDAIFVSSPDKTGAQLPPVGELRKYWDEVNGKLLSQFASLSADEWLQRHYAMSEEDYAKDPTRNRLAVLLSRTNHMSYHLGQITLALK